MEEVPVHDVCCDAVRYDYIDGGVVCDQLLSEGRGEEGFGDNKWKWWLDGVHHSNGHGGGLVLGDDSATSMLRYRVIAQSLDLGIAVGIGLSNVYSRSSPTALIVVRILNAASAGLLNYMVALVDLLASDFMGPRFQSNPMLQAFAYGSN
ncbi:hypothetical protein AMTR_s00120p00117000 [Amborella trichopoda]|uniref:Uncharacterized protein n=1 Tax=Amborella trichopoda TaxID=13333 RepID=W1NRA3_AMBTC|nr:hypothetical protein AMTR_s00120p00117000 [Amborella trichopoda]